MNRLETVNEKVIAGSIMYSLLEVILFLYLYWKSLPVLALAVFVIDNLALVTYNAPVELLTIRLMGENTTLENASIEERTYVVMGMLGSAFAFLVYPRFWVILLVSILVKVALAVYAARLPRVKNHTKFVFVKPDFGTVIPVTASEVFYLLYPIIVSSILGERAVGIFTAVMYFLIFAGIDRVLKMKKWYFAGFPVVMYLLPVVGMLLYPLVSSGLFFKNREETIGKNGLDDGIEVSNYSRVIGALLAYPLVTVFGVSVTTLVVMSVVMVVFSLASEISLKSDFIESIRDYVE